MKYNSLRTLVKEELKKAINEEYQDKYKMVGTLNNVLKKKYTLILEQSLELLLFHQLNHLLMLIKI